LGLTSTEILYNLGTKLAKFVVGLFVRAVSEVSLRAWLLRLYVATCLSHT
jgi:hypothetical protein